jgi:serine/threonine protein kinase
VSDEGRLVAGRYRIVQRIGVGAMGAVWQAHDEILARTVAVKQLLLQPGLEENDAEDARQRTMREGRIAARLHHPNAITVFDVVTDEHDQPCLIMEYLNSTSLAAVLQEHRTLPPTEVARIGAQVAAALREAHAVGIVHRDIKPGNILLGGNGVVKITDFGISRAKDDVTVTKTGMIAGTPAYLAPEVAIGGDPGPESDIFSLGSTLYAACEGQPPFGLSENTLSLLHAVAAGQINPPRQSGPLASVLAVLLHPDIHHRPTAEESFELLSAVARGETPLGGDTRMAPVAGVLGAAALPDGTRTFAGEDLAGAHSGTLLNEQGPAGGFYDDQEDDYAPASGYPEDDYDGYGHQDPTPSRAGMAATRAVPQAGAYADPYDDEDYDSPPPPPRAPRVDRPPYQDDDKPADWKKPAIIGGIVAIALIALGVWVFTPGNPAPTSTNTEPVGSTSVPLTPTPTLPSDTPSSTDPTTTEQSSTTEQTTSARHTTEQQSNPQQPPPVNHTTSRQPSTTPTTPSTKDTSSSKVSPPTTSVSTNP